MTCQRLELLCAMYAPGGCWYHNHGCGSNAAACLCQVMQVDFSPMHVGLVCCFAWALYVQMEIEYLCASWAFTHAACWDAPSQNTLTADQLQLDRDSPRHQQHSAPSRCTPLQAVQ
jgi:hypothetical protein